MQGRRGTPTSDVSKDRWYRLDDLHVTLADDISLRVQFSFVRGRTVTRNDVIDTKRAALLQPLATDILTKYFP